MYWEAAPPKTGNTRTRLSKIFLSQIARSLFELEKCVFFKQVRISPEIEGAAPLELIEAM